MARSAFCGMRWRRCRRRCGRVLSSREDFRVFERSVRSVLRAGVSALVTELDEERGWLHSGSMVRRSRPLVAGWSVG